VSHRTSDSAVSSDVVDRAGCMPAIHRQPATGYRLAVLRRVLGRENGAWGLRGCLAVVAALMRLQERPLHVRTSSMDTVEHRDDGAWHCSRPLSCNMDRHCVLC
jgi:hypothetical protein